MDTVRGTKCRGPGQFSSETWRCGVQSFSLKLLALSALASSFPCPSSPNPPYPVGLPGIPTSVPPFAHCPTTHFPSIYLV